MCRRRWCPWGIRYHDLSYVSHQKVLGSSTDLTWEICRAARKLFGELWDHRPVRLLGGAYQPGAEGWFHQADQPF